MQAIIFDTETDSAQAGARVIEAAWIDAGPSPHQTQDPQALQWCSRFNSERPISIGAMAIHHIIDADLVNAASYTTFALPEETRYLIGHNVEFDWQVIGSPVHTKQICTLALSRMLWPQFDLHKQVALMFYLLPHPEAQQLVRNAHSALADVLMCQKLLQAILGELTKRGQLPDSWDALWMLSEQARIPTHIYFGKHKGESIDALPKDYVAWLLKNVELDAYLRRALQSAMGS